MATTLVETNIEPPKELLDTATYLEILIWEKEVDLYTTQLSAYKSNKCALYSLVWGQCSELMQSKVKSISEYENMSDNNDSLLLLKTIKGISYRFESQSNLYLALDDAKINFYTYQQGTDEKNSACLSKFKSIIDVIEHYGGSIGNDEALVLHELQMVKLTLKTASEAQLIRATLAARNKAHAIAFIKRLDNNPYGLLVTELTNLFARGMDQYPTNITEAYNLLVTYKKPNYNNNRTPNVNQNNNVTSNNRNNAHHSTTNNAAPVPPPLSTEEMQFAQNAMAAPIDNSAIQCYHCKEFGHYAPACPHKKKSPSHQFFQKVCQTVEDSSDGEDEGTAPGLDVRTRPGFLLHQTHQFIPNVPSDYVPAMITEVGNRMFSFHQEHVPPTNDIDPSWILLDSESTISVFRNSKFLTNIRPNVASSLRILTNGGPKDVHLIGEADDLGTVWYCPQSLANILSLAAIRKVRCITMDSSVEAAIVVHKHDGTPMKFVEHTNGLYYNDSKSNKPSLHAYTLLLKSVAQNESFYTKKQLADAQLARRLYTLVGHPSPQTFHRMIRDNLLRHCPVTVEVAKRAFDIYGHDIGALRGETTRIKPDHVPTTPLYDLPPEIMMAHQQVTLCFDIFFVDSIPFLATVSRNIRFVTIENLNSRHLVKIILFCLQRVYYIYLARGFRIVAAHADDEFTGLKNHLLAFAGIRLNPAAANEHIPETERAIRSLKEIGPSFKPCHTNNIPDFSNYPSFLMRPCGLTCSLMPMGSPMFPAPAPSSPVLFRISKPTAGFPLVPTVRFIMNPHPQIGKLRAHLPPRAMNKVATFSCL